MVGLIEAEQDLCAGRDVAQLRHASIGRADAARTVLAPLQVWQRSVTAARLMLCCTPSGGTLEIKSGGPEDSVVLFFAKRQQRRTTMDTNSNP